MVVTEQETTLEPDRPGETLDVLGDLATFKAVVAIATTLGVSRASICRHLRPVRPA